jgi:hypothetical protein
MHDNPLHIKVEVKDAGASPSPAPKITGTDVKMKDLMSDVASMKAFAEAITESAAAVASAVAEEPAVAAAAATRGGRFREAACCEESHPRLRYGYR